MRLPRAVPSRPSRARPLRRRAGLVSAAALAFSAGAAALAGVGPSACSSTTSVNASLVSGIFIPSSLLTDNGNLGCGGDSAQQIYKYVAVVINDRGDIGGAGVFDCFSEIVFGNLPGIDGGQLNFAVWVWAYNAPDFAAANAGGKLVTAVQDLNGVNQPDGSVVPVLATSVPEGGARGDAGVYGQSLSRICLSQATWVTACSATSQAGVQSLADCRALVLEDAGARACSLPILLPDAGPDALPPG